MHAAGARADVAPKSARRRRAERGRADGGHPRTVHPTSRGDDHGDDARRRARRDRRVATDARASSERSVEKAVQVDEPKRIVGRDHRSAPPPAGKKESPRADTRAPFCRRSAWEQARRDVARRGGRERGAPVPARASRPVALPRARNRHGVPRRRRGRHGVGRWNGAPARRGARGRRDERPVRAGRRCRRRGGRWRASRPSPPVATAVEDCPTRPAQPARPRSCPRPLVGRARAKARSGTGRRLRRLRARRLPRQSRPKRRPWCRRRLGRPLEAARRDTGCPELHPLQGRPSCPRGRQPLRSRASRRLVRRGGAGAPRRGVEAHGGRRGRAEGARTPAHALWGAGARPNAGAR